MDQPEASSPGSGARISLGRLLREFGWLGITSFGAGRQMYLMDTFVRRLKVVSSSEFAEGLTISHTLPGPSVPNLAIYIGHLLQGGRGALVAALGFLAPGLLLTITFGAIVTSDSYPPILDGALNGAAAVSVAMLLSVVARLAPSTFRRVKAGPLVAFGTFIVAGPLHLGVFPALITFGALSIWLNRPRGG